MRPQKTLAEAAAGFRQRRAWLTLLVVIQLWLFTNGRAVLGREFPTELAQFYLFFMMWPLIADPKLLRDLLRGTALEYVLKFSAGYVVTIAAYYAVFVAWLHVEPAKVAYSQVAALIVLQLAFVAPAEELFFRGFMPRVYNPQGKSWKLYGGISVSNALWTGSFALSDVVASATFSGFHYSAYGKDAFSAFVIAFVLSVVWIFASRVALPQYLFQGERRPVGLALTMGSHAAFNLCALGILTGGVVLGL